MKNCPSPQECRTRGMIPFRMAGGEFDNQPFTAECEAYKRFKIRQARLSRAEKILGPLFEYDFDGFDRRRNPEAYRYARMFAEKRGWEAGGWLILYGNYGTGKTRLAAAILREAIIEGVHATFVNLADVMAMEIEKVKKKLRELTEYDLAVIDDFGVEISQNWLMPTVFSIFNTFAVRKKSIVLTTNLPLKAFQEIVGDRIADRIGERAVAIETVGDSYRGKNRSSFVGWSRE